MFFYVLNLGICRLSRKLSGRLIFEAVEFTYDNTSNLLLDKIIQPEKQIHTNKVMTMIKDDPTKWNHIRPLATVQDVEAGLEILRSSNDAFIRPQYEYPLNVMTIFEANCRLVASVCKNAYVDCPNWLKLKLIQLCGQEIATVLNISYDEALKLIQKEVS